MNEARYRKRPVNYSSFNRRTKHSHVNVPDFKIMSFSSRAGRQLSNTMILPQRMRLLKRTLKFWSRRQMHWPLHVTIRKPSSPHETARSPNFYMIRKPSLPHETVRSPNFYMNRSETGALLILYVESAKRTVRP